MTYQPPNDDFGARRDEPSESPQPSPWADPTSPPAYPTSEPAGDPAAPAGPPADLTKHPEIKHPEEDPAYDPYRFGRPSANPFGYPSSAPGQQPPGQTNQSPYPSQPYPGQTNQSPYPPQPYGQQNQPPYQPPYPPQGPYNAYPPQARTNSKATAALVFGILALVCFFLTFLDLPFIVLGIVYGILGIKAANRGQGGRTKAVWGLSLAIIGAVACAAITAYAIPRYVDCSHKFDTSSSEFNSCLRGNNA